MQRFLEGHGSRQGAIFQNHLPHREASVFVFLPLTAQGAQELLRFSRCKEGAWIREEAGVEVGGWGLSLRLMLSHCEAAPPRTHPPGASVCSLHPYFHLNQGLCWVSA